MNKLRITITGQPAKKLTSKRTGNEFSLLEVYAHAGGPYPEKIVIFEDVRLPRGIYDVPLNLQVRNERLELQLDFTSAVEVK